MALLTSGILATRSRCRTSSIGGRPLHHRAPQPQEAESGGGCRSSLGPDRGQQGTPCRTNPLWHTAPTGRSRRPRCRSNGANRRGPESAFRPYCGSLAGFRPKAGPAPISGHPSCVWWESYGAERLPKVYALWTASRFHSRFSSARCAFFDRDESPQSTPAGRRHEGHHARANAPNIRAITPPSRVLAALRIQRPSSSRQRSVTPARPLTGC